MTGPNAPAELLRLLEPAKLEPNSVACLRLSQPARDVIGDLTILMVAQLLIEAFVGRGTSAVPDLHHPPAAVLKTTPIAWVSRSQLAVSRSMCERPSRVNL